MTNADSASKANAERFDAIAATWDENPTRVATARGVAGAILATVTLAGTEQAMEFGCGTGLVTGLLAPNLGHVLAVDGSEGMLDVLRGKLQGHGIGNVETLQADLPEGMPAGPFDFVYSSLTMHHIEDVEGLLARIHDGLAPGGRIALADLAREDGSFHREDTAGIMHHGFDSAQLKRWAEVAGFADISVTVVHQISKTRPDGSTHEYPVLLMTARRPG